MKGSWSIKHVLPAIVPELSYQELGKVQDGMAAGTAFIESLGKDTPADRREWLRSDLLKYCELDTLAMVKLAHKLSGVTV